MKEFMLERIYSTAMSWRNFLYDGDILDAVKIPVPVLSVGNLTAGGSGKTPMVEWILRQLQGSSGAETDSETAEAKIARGCVVARNYRALSKSAFEVDLGHPQAPAYFGDEAYQIKNNFPQVSVWTGPEKYLTAQLAFQLFQDRKQKMDYLIVDDGFQHRALNRDFDLVLLDASAPMEQWHLLPKGRMREPFSELRRADAVVLTKVNFAHPEKLEYLRAKVKENAPHLTEGDRGEVAFKPLMSRSFQHQERVLLVSGIAQPTSFLASVKSMDPHQEIQIIDHLVFPDHHQYSIGDLDRILKARRDYSGQRILTTEKDAVKFRHLGLSSTEFEVLGIELVWEKESEALRGFLSKIRRS